MIIQTILYPSGAIWTDEASNVSRRDPSRAIEATPSIRLVIGRPLIIRNKQNPIRSMP
jgi:hypothetical protein